MMRKLLPGFAVIFLSPLFVHCGPAETSSAKENAVRPSALAGAWYLKDPAKLRARLGLYLERAGEPELAGRPLALISPHAGYRYSGQAAAYGFKALLGRDIRRVVILGLSHSVAYTGASVPDFSHYETPLGRVPVDREAVAKLRAHPLFGLRPEVHTREHSIEMQIPFLQAVLKEKFAIVPVVFGRLDEKDYPAAALALRGIVDEGTVVIASSDFTHYGKRFGYVPFDKHLPKNIEALDMGALKAVINKDFAAFYAHRRRTGATICGRVPIGVLLNMLPPSARGTLLRYYRSAELTGEWDGSVSYASVLFTKGKKDAVFKGSERTARRADMLAPAEQRNVLALARATVDSYVRSGKVPTVEALSEKVKAGLVKKRGVFVTLRKHGRLRGCIGSIVGQVPLYEGVIRNAVSSCAFDHRFNPVTVEELKDIEVEVSVLSTPRPVSGHEKILPGWHGIILRKGVRSAVFLPQVAMEQNWEVEETLTRLARKAGLPSDAWKSGARLEVFEAQIIPE